MVQTAVLIVEQIVGRLVGVISEIGEGAVSKRGGLFQIGGWRLEVRNLIKMEFAFGEFPQIDLTSNFQPLISSVGGAGAFLRAALSRACWQIIGGEGMAVHNGVSLVLIVCH